SFAVAEYQDYSIYAHPTEMQGDSLLIQNYIYDSPGCLDNYKTDIDRTVEFIELFSNLYSLYPFHEEKYGHCLTAMGGGMEHQTMTTMGRFGFGIVAHELGHMWFGDNVTCATWSDIWINEGFATYTDYLAHEYVAGGEWPQIWLKLAHGRVLAEPGGSVYVPPEEIIYNNESRIFNSRLSYYKGALIIHMIRYELQDDDLFFQVLKNFQEEFRDNTATGMDFMNVLNETSGMDFTEFFDHWYFGEGYPIYYISWVQQNNILQINSSQISSIPQITPFFKMHLPYKLFFNDGTDTTINLYQTEHDLEFALPFDKPIDSILIDPEQWVLKKVAYLNKINENYKNLEFEIYPNPAYNQLRIIVNNYSPLEITVADLNGKIVIEAVGNQPITNLDISKLYPGAYFILIRSGEKTYSKKFIKIN
ncbi:MAG: T9SS type A sorting domain-containing protein, partial [Bacteroidales bacterium]|nr:T9SS type A sorting domain-containing protein [Bacteroidales bacterium]